MTLDIKDVVKYQKIMASLFEPGTNLGDFAREDPFRLTEYDYDILWVAAEVAKVLGYPEDNK